MNQELGAFIKKAMLSFLIEVGILTGGTLIGAVISAVLTVWYKVPENQSLFIGFMPVAIMIVGMVFWLRYKTTYGLENTFEMLWHLLPWNQKKRLQ